jgi:hypothetical protein
VIIALDMRQGHSELCGLDVRNIPVGYNEGRDLYVSAVYAGTTICEMMYSPGDSTSTRMRHDNIIRPEGRIRVLAVGIDRHNTSLATEFSTEWAEAQESINRDHSQYASAAGLADPILQFESTNVVVRESELHGSDPRDMSVLRGLLAEAGHDPSRYDAVLVLDLDPANPEGGRVLNTRAVVVGWFFAERRGPVDISADEWLSLARAGYHHEIGHLHGWRHHWPGGPSHNLITLPQLYGWTDLDGDGVIEIRDADPYGSD